MPFALVDRPDDTWYRLHLDTDDDLYEVDMVRAGHRATAASMKGAAAKRRRRSPWALLIDFGEPQ